MTMADREQRSGSAVIRHWPKPPKRPKIYAKRRRRRLTWFFKVPSAPTWLKPPLTYYWDNHLTRKDLMSQSDPHSRLIRYLVILLEWYFLRQGWYISDNLGVHETGDYADYPVEPDVAVFKAILSDAEKRRLRSWSLVRDDRPVAAVTFEIASYSTWERDLEEKVERYRLMGVQEYFTYDPHEPPAWETANTRLRGWKLVGEEYEELTPDSRGWLWSNELDSWLGPDDQFLRLYDAEGRRRLTEAEEMTHRAEQATIKADQAILQEEQTRLELGESRREQRQARLEAQQALEREEQTRRREEVLRAKLREMGLDPDNL